MHQKQFIWPFVAAVVGIPLIVFVAVKWYEDYFQQIPVMGGMEHRIANFSMINAKGKQVTLENWKGKVVLVDFFFTHCPTICPRMTSNLKKVQGAFPGNQGLVINSFSIDPERDSAARLAVFAQQFNIDQANWHLLTGDKKAIYRLARKSFLVTATDGDGGPDDFIHSDQLVLVDRQKRIRGYYSGTNEKAVKKAIRDIGRLLKE